MSPIVVGNATLYRGDCLDVLKTIADNSIDSIVTDPPYGLTSARKSGRSPATEGKVINHAQKQTKKDSAQMSIFDEA